MKKITHSNKVLHLYSCVNLTDKLHYTPYNKSKEHCDDKYLMV